MFGFSQNYADDDKGVEGAKIIHRTADFNNKMRGWIFLFRIKS